MPRKARVLVRFTDEHDIVWTVWDASFSEHKNHRKAHGDQAASTRVFVNSAGVRRIYRFKKGETRVLAESELDRQLSSAEYAHTGKPFDPSSHGAR